jgi:GNAT superfamily N-acetyltransferase
MSEQELNLLQLAARLVTKPRTGSPYDGASATTRGALGQHRLGRQRRHVRTVPIPGWVKHAIDIWCTAGNIKTGNLFGYLVVYYPHLLVLPAYQGHGFGGAILEHMKLKYLGFHQHILVADGKAVDFYQKHGFESAGKTQSMWIYEGNDH